ncbi:hypothetical protein RJT34_08055 [Clitoria ternatea]|uniref:Transmembrane protein n=1 Tax=Clitoria ternatea TaxID=43366 RepID=A0AAN9K5R2_CLITE
MEHRRLKHHNVMRTIILLNGPKKHVIFSLFARTSQFTYLLIHFVLTGSFSFLIVVNTLGSSFLIRVSGAFLAQYAICFHFPSLPVQHCSKPFPSRASLPRSTPPHRRLLRSSSPASLSISEVPFFPCSCLFPPLLFPFPPPTSDPRPPRGPLCFCFCCCWDSAGAVVYGFLELL